MSLSHARHKPDGKVIFNCTILHAPTLRQNYEITLVTISLISTEKRMTHMAGLSMGEYKGVIIKQSHEVQIQSKQKRPNQIARPHKILF